MTQLGPVFFTDARLRGRLVLSVSGRFADMFKSEVSGGRDPFHFACSQLTLR